MLSDWDPTGDNPPQWSIAPNGIDLQLTVQNGDTCGITGMPRTITVNFICDPTAIAPASFVVTEPSTCNYAWDFPTSAVCASAPPPPALDTPSQRFKAFIIGFATSLLRPLLILVLIYLGSLGGTNIVPGLACVLVNCKRSGWDWKHSSSAFSPKCMPGRFTDGREFRFFRAGTSLNAAIRKSCMGLFNCCTWNCFKACKQVQDAHLFFDDAIFYGEKAEFGGDSCSYCTEVVCVNSILNNLSAVPCCGCWEISLWSALGCADRRERKWLDSRIRWKSRVPAEWVYYQAQTGTFFKVVMCVLNVCTCFLFSPSIRFCTIRNMLETSPEAVFGGHRVEFTGTVCDFYVGVHFPNQFFNVITLGMWSFFGFASRREGRWLDGNLESLHKTEGGMVAPLLMNAAAHVATQHHISRVDTTGLLSTEARLAALYRMNDPTKDAEVIAEKFRGNEAQLFSLLIRKYGEEAIDAGDAAALGELMDKV